MDRTQAETIAQAILEPGVRAQEEMRRRRAVRTHRLVRKRKVAWFVLAGCGIGSVAAYFTGTRVAQGVLWGVIAGLVLGGLFIWWRSRPHAA